MHRYIIRRLLVSIPMLIGITLIVFTLANLIPGDPLTAMMSEEAPMSGEAMDQRREALGLNQPLPIRYFLWIKEVVQGNLGFSFITYVPIGETILDRIPQTLQLMGISLLLSIIIGTFLGIVSALKQYQPIDYVLTVFAFVGRSIPVFFVGMLLIYFFSLRMDLFPVSGMVTVGMRFNIWDNLWHLVLPCASLSLLRVSEFMRYARSSMLEVLASDYITTARSKGVKENSVVLKHGFRNALIPILTVIGFNLQTLFSGAIIIETVFQWPGMGQLFISAVHQRDYPMIMGLSLVISIVVLIGNLLTDISYAFADPRIRYQ